MSSRSTTVPALFAESIKSSPVSSRRCKQDDFDHEVIKQRVRQAGMEVFRISSLSNGHGVQYAVVAGGIVTVYNTGTVVVGGKVSAKDKKRLQRAFGTR